MTAKATRITINCFDGSYDFQITMAGCAAIEEKCSTRIGRAYAEIMRGRFKLGEQEFGAPAESDFSPGLLVEVIRQGLIGGGKGQSDGQEIEVSPFKAESLIRTYITPDAGVALMEAWNLAAAIIHALMHGVDSPAAVTNDDGNDASADLSAEAAA